MIRKQIFFYRITNSAINNDHESSIFFSQFRSLCYIYDTWEMRVSIRWINLISLPVYHKFEKKIRHKFGILFYVDHTILSKDNNVPADLEIQDDLVASLIYFRDTGSHGMHFIEWEFYKNIIHTCSENFAASITAGGKLGVVAGTAVNFVHFTAELLVHQRHLALLTQETLLMPVLVLVRQVL